MKANIAKKVLLCTLSAALLAAPCAGVSAAGTGAGTKAASSGSSITAEVEEIVTANAWVGSDDNSGSGSSPLRQNSLPEPVQPSPKNRFRNCHRSPPRHWQ